MSLRIARSAFHSMHPILGMGRFATASLNPRIRNGLPISIRQRLGVQASTVYRSYGSDRSDRPTFCNICPMRLVYSSQDSHAHSSTSQKTHVKAVVMLGLAFGLTTYIMQKIKRANESNTSPNYVK